MDKAEKAIKLWRKAPDRMTPRSLGLNRAEMGTMKKVLRESEGVDMPWFYQYSIKKGLL